ncbi:hypothetical protein RI367_004356 [Sorochytrium milnesiophthora]
MDIVPVASRPANDYIVSALLVELQTSFTLHIAVLAGNLEKLAVLLDATANGTLPPPPLGLPDSAITPMHLAAFKNRPDIVTLLVQHRAKLGDVNAADCQGMTPLFYAIMENNLSVCATLMAFGARLDVHNKTGLTPLHLAVICEHIDICKYLLLHSVKVDARDLNGNTVLHVARNPYIITLLLRHDSTPAAINARNTLGMTPLHVYASVHFDDHTAVVRELLEAGADPSLRENYHRTPLQVVLEAGLRLELDSKAKVLAETAKVLAKASGNESLLNSYYWVSAVTSASPSSQPSDPGAPTLATVPASQSDRRPAFPVQDTRAQVAELFAQKKRKRSSISSPVPLSASGTPSTQTRATATASRAETFLASQRLAPRPAQPSNPLERPAKISTSSATAPADKPTTRPRTLSQQKNVDSILQEARRFVEQQQPRFTPPFNPWLYSPVSDGSGWGSGGGPWVIPGLSTPQPGSLPPFPSRRSQSMGAGGDASDAGSGWGAEDLTAALYDPPSSAGVAAEASSSSLSATPPSETRLDKSATTAITVTNVALKPAKRMQEDLVITEMDLDKEPDDVVVAQSPSTTPSNGQNAASAKAKSTPQHESSGGEEEYDSDDEPISAGRRTSLAVKKEQQLEEANARHSQRTSTRSRLLAQAPDVVINVNDIFLLLPYPEEPGDPMWFARAKGNVRINFAREAARTTIPFQYLERMPAADVQRLDSRGQLKFSSLTRADADRPDTELPPDGRHVFRVIRENLRFTSSIRATKLLWNDNNTVHVFQCEQDKGGEGNIIYISNEEYRRCAAFIERQRQLEDQLEREKDPRSFYRQQRKKAKAAKSLSSSSSASLATSAAAEGDNAAPALQGGDDASPRLEGRETSVASEGERSQEESVVMLVSDSEGSEVAAAAEAQGATSARSANGLTADPLKIRFMRRMLERPATDVAANGK